MSLNPKATSAVQRLPGGDISLDLLLGERREMDAGADAGHSVLTASNQQRMSGEQRAAATGHAPPARGSLRSILRFAEHLPLENQ